MSGAVPWILAFASVAIAASFRFLPGRVAASLALIGGWAVLPVADYPPTVIPEPGSLVSPMHALAVPTPILANKALAIGLGALVGIVAFDWGAVRRLRPRWIDAPLACWCLWPIVSALGNGLPIAEGLGQVRYLLLAWGVPYLMGRAYFTGENGLRAVLNAWAIAGLAYLPACLAEFVAGPFLYEVVYGPHPYRFDGAERAIGFRPLVFLEHGNQLGMWVATAAASAVGLWRSGRPASLLGMPIALAAALLAAQALACQSHGAILLLLAGLPMLLMVGRRGRGLTLDRGAILSLSVSAAIVAGVLLAAGAGPLRSRARDLFRSIGKGSFTWRLARYEEMLPRAAGSPWIGLGRADWSAATDGTFADPAALGAWALIFGHYGAIAAAASLAVLAWPAARCWIVGPSSGRGGASAIVLATAGVIVAMNAGDALLNALILPPAIALAAGLGGTLDDQDGAKRPR